VIWILLEFQTRLEHISPFLPGLGSSTDFWKDPIALDLRRKTLDHDGVIVRFNFGRSTA
jgi:hypothetical protein